MSPAAGIDPFLDPPFTAGIDDAVLAVVGLGYVGLPLAVALAASGRRVIGFDIDAARVGRIAAGRDDTGEVDGCGLSAALAAGFRPASDPDALAGAGVVIVCVPTPITGDRQPDLGPLLSACATIGPRLRPGSVVVFESTVYPGVTEDVCGPALAAASGLVVGRDLLLGYAPERINPGDRLHRLDTIVKVVAGQTPALADALARLYGALNGGQVHVTPSIRVAEAAKAIENAQRDINIAFVNEIALIFERIGLSVHDVLDAARTKWNFLDFKPGLVGGHCIGVDPYYLSHLSQVVGHEPDVILAGRRLNDHMADELADRIAFRFREVAPDVVRPRALILGLTFKEDVPDLRNSKVPQLAARLVRHGFTVDLHDPVADASDVALKLGLALVDVPADMGVPMFDLVVLAVGHRAFAGLTPDDVGRMVHPQGLIADPKGVWRHRAACFEQAYWSL
ncbi:nucleotide sugar dehydrogenase [Tistrella bauzanensis]|uniref:Nucleotide sugar dehydrogenase n=1 Tax=Tistrella arctica TaxID=3133430 RepID=A0ABU9YS23_9PROT